MKKIKCKCGGDVVFTCSDCGEQHEYKDLLNKISINDCYNTKCSYWRKTKMCKKYLNTEECKNRISTYGGK